MSDTSSRHAQRQYSRSERNERDRAAFGPFDPLTTISELQAQGIRAASDIAYRLTALLDPGASSAYSDTPSRDGNGRTGVGELRGTVSRLIDLYGDVLQRTFDAYADLLEQRARMGPHLDGGAAGAVRVEIASTGVDLAGTGELWLANGTEAATGRLQLVATALVGATGWAPAATVLLDPSTVEIIAPGAATRVTVTIEVEAGTPPGYYHGYVLVPELPGEALPVTLHVRSGPEEDAAS